jgi:hypothetical protein
MTTTTTTIAMMAVVIVLLHLGLGCHRVAALTGDEIVLMELAWVERRIRVYRHGFGDANFQPSSGSGSVDAGMTMTTKNSDAALLVVGGQPSGPGGGWERGATDAAASQPPPAVRSGVRKRR